MGFVYAFYDNSDCKGIPIYIGKTKHLENRLYQHFGAREKYLQKDAERVMAVRYAEFGKNYGLVETNLIHKYRPILNKFYNCYSENVMRRFCVEKIDLKHLSNLIRREQIDRRYAKNERLEQD